LSIHADCYKKSNLSVLFYVSLLGYNNNFNDRGSFHDRDRDANRGGRRNWNDDNERRGGSFPPRGGFDRSSRSKRWGNSRERDEYDSSEQNDQEYTEQNQESRSENIENNNDEHESNQVNEELPPGTENYEESSMDHPKSSFDSSSSAAEPQEEHHHHQQQQQLEKEPEQHQQQDFNEDVPADNNNSSSVNESAVEESNQGNTTPLCDEAKE